MTAKAAVRGYTEALRISITPHGIGVSLLFPGSTRTSIMDEAMPRDQEVPPPAWPLRTSAVTSCRRHINILLRISHNQQEHLGARMIRQNKCHRSQSAIYLWRRL